MLQIIWFIGYYKCGTPKGYGPPILIATVRTIFIVHFPPFSLLPLFYFQSRYCLPSHLFVLPTSLSLHSLSPLWHSNRWNSFSHICPTLFPATFSGCVQNKDINNPCHPLYLCLAVHSASWKYCNSPSSRWNKFNICCIPNATLCIMKRIYRRFINQIIGEYRNVEVTFKMVQREHWISHWFVSQRRVVLTHLWSHKRLDSP